MRTSADGRSALVRFLTSDEGGRFTAPRSGVRSQLKIGDVMTSCTVTAIDGRDLMALGDEIVVRVRLQFPERFEAEFPNLVEVLLFEGTKLVAVGTFDD